MIDILVSVSKKKRNTSIPFDVRIEYCKSVDIYRQIQNYELKLISEYEFVTSVREIISRYKEIDNNFK